MNNVIHVEWAEARKVHEAYSLHPRRLKQLETEGFIRSYKAGTSIQAQKLYCCSDVDSYLKALSAGKKPKIKRGKIS